MRKKSTLLFIVFFLICKTPQTFAQVSTADSLALVTLYNNTNGSGWINNGNWLSGPVSTWYGITVSGSSVTGINLSSNNLTGTIPSSLGNLANLYSLALGTNNLTGAIPSSLGNLVNLSALVLGKNNLTDSIPYSLGNLTNLSYLDLTFNQLSGSIPYSLGNLSLLNTLYLYNNQLSGSIPGTLGNLSILGDLELNNNLLSGSILDSLSMLVFLNYLDLSSNQITGNIPASFSSLSNINTLNLYNNQLSGSIPPSLSTLSTLQYLNISSNQLGGSIPASFNSLSKLQGISLRNNQLTGSIPATLGKSNVFFLDLSHNQLRGTVPSSFANLTSSSTYINNNNLTFDGLETVVTALPGTLVDSPQAKVPLHLTGSTLSVYAGGTLANDSFHWYKNGAPDTTIVGDSTYTSLFPGNYNVIVSNKIVTPATGLTINSDTSTGGVILPVSFLNFTGSLVSNNTLLQWQTGNQLNTSYFNVQRSADAVNFTNIGKVNTTNSAATQAYHYTDNLSLLAGKPAALFYRLQQQFTDGSNIYSNIIKVEPGVQAAALAIYPNPVRDIINIAAGSNSGDALIEVFDINGNKILQQQQALQPAENISIGASQLIPGIYVVRITANCFTTQQKFVKE